MFFLYPSAAAGKVIGYFLLKYWNNDLPVNA
jgi:hypothetical protein